jgi:hypothetical protein
VKVSTRNAQFLAVLLGTLGCGKSTVPAAPRPTTIQAAAVGFIARANGDRAPCVRVADGPNELTRGRVTEELQDPPRDFESDLKTQGIAGVTVRAFSTCSAAERDKLTYAIGWPRPTPGGFQVNADRLCGVRCGEGNLVLIKNVGASWRAVEAETTWRP